MVVGEGGEGQQCIKIANRGKGGVEIANQEKKGEGAREGGSKGRAKEPFGGVRGTDQQARGKTLY